MRKLFLLLKNNLYFSLLILVCIAISISNYSAGTILSGWDTLHPEFNRLEYLKRILQVWQTHQGLGSLATQSHLAEIPRMILYIPLSLITGVDLARYYFMFIMIFSGAIGIYFLTKYLLDSQKIQNTPLVSSLSGMFYVLNLSTLQHFNVPLEMFTLHFASLPWIFLFITRFFYEKSKMNILYYSIICFFTAPISHTPTLWYVFFTMILAYLLTQIIIKRSKEILFKSLHIAFITIAINLFWILPSLYFFTTNGHVVQESKIHSLFSEEAFLQNAAFGTLDNLALFKNFLFNWKIFTFKNSFSPLLEPWEIHLQNPLVMGAGFFLFLITILGIANIIFYKNKKILPFLPLYLICLFFWLNINPPFGNIFLFFQENIPFFKEVFRFPFTKFSIFLTFISSLFFAYGITFLLNLLSKMNRSKNISIIVFFTFYSCLIFYMLPAFKGYFINPSMRVKIPNEYFQMFNWINSQPEARVATLPVHSFWGWTYYKWGYQGAGFLWFGIKYPLLDREFDRWNNYNEQYYREISQAVYTKNNPLLNEVLKKYKVGYILLDKNIVAPGNKDEVLFYKEIEDLLKTNKYLSAKKSFGKNLIVYSTNPLPSRFTSIKNASVVSPKNKIVYEDNIYIAIKDYVSENNRGIYFPFAELINNQNLINKDIVSMAEEGTKIKLGNYKLSTQKNVSRYEIPAQIFIKNNKDQSDIQIYPFSFYSGRYSDNPIELNAKTNGKNITISVNNSYIFNTSEMEEDSIVSLGNASLESGTKNYIRVFSSEAQAAKPILSADKINTYTCNSELIRADNFGISIDAKREGFSIFGKDTTSCAVISLKDLQPQISKDILLKISLKQHGPKPIQTCLSDINTGICKYQNINDLSSDRKTNTDLYFFIDSDPKNLGLKFMLDASSSNGETYYSRLSDVSLETLKINDVFYLDGSKIDLNLNNESGQALELTYPYTGSESLSLDITKLPKNDGRCSDNQLFTYDNKKSVSREEKDKFIRYISKEGSLCDHFQYPQLDQKNSYIIAITARNIKGLPVRLCIANYVTKRCDLYTTLSKSKEFKTDLFLIPPMQFAGSLANQLGYDLNINNFGIKNIESINDIKSITITTFPYAWLSSLQSDYPKNIPSQKPISSTGSNVIDFKDVFENKNPTASIISINQSYNSGWRAYFINKNPSLAERFAPFIFGTKINNHLLVNDWENGWNIDPESHIANKDKSIIFIYLPQYLSYPGYALIFILTIIYLKLILHKKN